MPAIRVDLGASLAEAQWTLLGLWLLGLMTVRRLVEADTDPLECSVARARDAVRRAMRGHRARRGPRSLEAALRAAVRDRSVRRGDKAARNYPRKKRQKPPVSHTMVMVHPISGRKILYVDPGYTVSIDGMDKRESDELLEFLFQHQLQPQFQYAHRWAEGDVLIWDDLQTLHNAEADYRADEPRLIKRCQAMADQVFKPEFRRLAQIYGEPQLESV